MVKDKTELESFQEWFKSQRNTGRRQSLREQDTYLRYSWSWKWVFRGFVRVWGWLIERAGVKKGIELWERVLLGERLWYEQNDRSYSVGLAPPHVRMCVYGKWVDELGKDSIKLVRG